MEGGGGRSSFAGGGEKKFFARFARDQVSQPPFLIPVYAPAAHSFTSDNPNFPDLFIGKIQCVSKCFLALRKKDVCHLAAQP